MTKEQKIKLLESMAIWMQKYSNPYDGKTYRDYVKDFVDSGNLNPVEPEPFTGIKGDENICKRCNNEIWVEIEDGFWDFQCQCNILTYMK